MDYYSFLPLIILANIFILSTIFYFVFNSFDIIKCFVLGFINFFGLYVVISGVYFWIDNFTVFKSTFSCLLFEIALLLILFLFGHVRNFNYLLDVKKLIAPIIIIIISLPFVINKFEFFGMGQDQGVYQTKAINLIYQKAKRQQDFKEYHDIKNKKESSNFGYLVQTRLVGFDRFDSGKPTLSKKDRLSSISGIYHGIPTFPALLALWGKIFGLTGMASIQTIFFIIAIFLLYYVSINLEFYYYNNVLCLLLFAFSPIVIWASKSSLTEIFICDIILLYLLYMTESDDIKINWLSWIPIAYFSFYHVSCFAFMPIFILIFWFFIIKSKNPKNYLVSSIISLIFFEIGFIMMAYVSPTYTFNNFSRSLLRPPLNLLFIRQSICLSFTQLVSIITILLSCLIYFYRSSIYLSLIRIIDCKYILIALRVIIILLLCYIAYHGYCIAYGIIEPHRMSTQGYFYGKGLFAFKQLTLAAFLFNTGLIVLPIVIFASLFNIKVFFEKKATAIVYILFIYCVLFYSAFMKKEVAHYYYYSRYIVPFIPLILLCAGIYLKNKNKYIITIIIAISFTALFRYNNTLLNNLDDTKLEWKNLSNIASIVDKKDVLIVDNNLMATFFLPLRAMTSASVIPKYNDINHLVNNNDKDVYFITKNDECMLDNKFFETVVKLPNTESEDRVHNHSNILPFPTEMSIQKTFISLLKYNKPKLIYDFKEENNFKHYGFYNLEKNFKWTKNGESYIVMYLPINNYEMIIKQGPGIPIGKLNIESISARISFNHQLIGQITIDSSKSNQKSILFIPKNLVNEGRNILNVKTDVWSPNQYGSSDSRKLGISIRKIILKK